jgi:hypothetical protein
VVLCPDVAPYIDSRFDCCDLLQRSVIHYGAERKASSAIISIPHSGRNDRLSDSGRGFCRLSVVSRVFRTLVGLSGSRHWLKRVMAPLVC